MLERWITPSLFDGLDARDEYEWSRALGTDAAARINKHRQIFITDKDLSWLAGRGVQALRLPVPHWIFGGFEPYIPCAGQVSWLLDRAQDYGLKVLLDLHTAPGSQNGEAHSGRAGSVEWLTGDTEQQTLNVLSKIAKTYGTHQALMGIEVINEPSRDVPHARLLVYYQAAVQTVRAAAPGCMVVVSDAFRPNDWLKPQLRDYTNVVLDMHLYRAFSGGSMANHFKAVEAWHDLIVKIGRHTPVMVGEWSGGLSPSLFKDKAEASQNTSDFVRAQQHAFQEAHGAFFWTYKTENMHGWDYRHMIANQENHVQ